MLNLNKFQSISHVYQWFRLLSLTVRFYNILTHWSEISAKCFILLHTIYHTIEYDVYYFLLGDVINNYVSININGPSIRTRTEFSNTPLMILLKHCI